jgi:hypothetical protein
VNVTVGDPNATGIGNPFGVIEPASMEATGWPNATGIARPLGTPVADHETVG